MTDLEKIFEFSKISEKLKSAKRWLNTEEMVDKESSADHSWNLALLAFLTADTLKLSVDVLKSIKLALVHDLVEALAGDTDHSLIAFGLKSKEEKQRLENEAMAIIHSTLPKKTGAEIKNIWLEYEKGESIEARYIKALDKIETINHMAVIGYGCFDHPELIVPYPRKAVMNFPPLIPMYKELLKRLKPEFEKKGWEWLEEYEV